MRIVLTTLLLSFVVCSAVWSQTTPTPKTPPAKKPASAATPKPATVAPGEPTAIIDTSAGKMTCTLFPDKAPVGVANFIGLAQGTKDWTNPVSHAKKHGVPLYDGTIFHRVIPNFMIQGGEPNTKDEKDKSKYGMGGPGSNVKAEFNDRPHVRGIVSMARAQDPDSAGSVATGQGPAPRERPPPWPSPRPGIADASTPSLHVAEAA